MCEFQNDQHLKALRLQVSATTYDRERLNSLKALDVDILTGFGTILDSQTVSTNNFDWVVIANPWGSVYHTLEVDATLIAIVQVVVITCGFVLVDENIRAKRNMPRWRKRNKLDRERASIR